ncbi:MAG: hypothetical protein ACU84Q_03495 [Gammaproteobacteria bacterium]
MQPRLLLTAFLVCVALNVSAANRNVTLANDLATNHIMVWADDPANVDITEVTFLSSSMSGWVSTIAADGSSANLSGATLAPSDFSIPSYGGVFRLRFSFPAPTFSFQWAELNFDGTNNFLLGSGTLTYAAGSGYSASNTFTHLADIPAVASPVPLANSTIFMISGAAMLGFLRRPNHHNNRKTRTQ